MDDSDFDRIRKLLMPEEHECPICQKTYPNKGELSDCVQKHAREEVMRKYQEEMLREPDPEPDESLVSLMEAMSGIENDDKNKISR